MSVHNRLDVDLLEVCYLKKKRHDWLLKKSYLLDFLFLCYKLHNVLAGQNSYRFEVKNYPNPS